MEFINQQTLKYWEIKALFIFFLDSNHMVSLSQYRAQKYVSV